MTLPSVVWGVLGGAAVFALTAAENHAVSRERAYEMHAYKATDRARGRTWAIRSAWWAAWFETILVVWLLMGLESPWLALVAIPGAFYGQYRAIMSRVDRRLEKQQDEDE